MNGIVTQGTLDIFALVIVVFYIIMAGKFCYSAYKARKSQGTLKWIDIGLGMFFLTCAIALCYIRWH